MVMFAARTESNVCVCVPMGMFIGGGNILVKYTKDACGYITGYVVASICT